MAKIIITGPTGNAGSAILTQALLSPSISSVVTLSRRSPYPTSTSTVHGSSPTPSPGSKLNSILTPSDKYPGGFDNPAELLKGGELEGCSGAIWALGISQNAVNKQDYIKITHDYTLSAANAFKSLGSPARPFRFVYISGEGADQSESSRFLFGQIKGRTERALMAMEDDGFKVVSVRPSAIIPTPEHASRMGWLMRTTLSATGSIFGRLMPSMVIPSSDLGKVCVDLVTGHSGGWGQRGEGGFLSNSQLRALATAL